MLLGAKEVAQYLEMPRQVVTELAKNGFLSGKMVGGAWIFEKEEVEGFINRNHGLAQARKG